MKKKMYVAVVVALMAVLTVFGVSSEARVMEFDYFTVDVPDGWKVIDDKENMTVGLTAPDASAAITVSIFEDEDNMTVEEYGMAFQMGMDGENLTEMDGGYMFTFTNQEGLEAVGIVTGEDNMIMFMTITGEHKDVEKIIDSMEQK